VTNPQLATLDWDGDGDLEDSDRDADNDGLSDYVEFNGPGIQKWWPAQFNTPPEKAYTWRHFSDVSPINPDSDGDGIPDGQDDQDNDGWNNFEEMQLNRWRTGLRVHAFNPCLPDPYSLTCGRFVPAGGSAGAWPPFRRQRADVPARHAVEPGAARSGDPVLMAGPRPAGPPVGAATDYPGWLGASGPQGPGV